MNRLIKYLLIFGALLIGLGYSVAQPQSYIPDPAFRLFLQTNYPHLMNGDNLLHNPASGVSGKFDCSGQNIADLEGIQYFKNLDTLDCSNNKLTSMPSLANYNPFFAKFICAQNMLSDLPQLRPDKLSYIDCSNNLFAQLPDLTYLTLLDTLICNNNLLTFDDLLKAKNENTLLRFIYAPQAAIVIPAAAVVNEGESYSFIFPADDTVSTNHYTLERNGMVKYNPAVNTFEAVNLMVADAGEYQWKVTNSQLPLLVLHSTLLQLTVNTTTVPPPPTPVYNVFTPNGDGNHDTYPVLCNGVSVILNRFGIMVKTFSGPQDWDGTDSNGNLLPTGVYIIRCDNSDTTVNLIR